MLLWNMKDIRDNLNKYLKVLSSLGEMNPDIVKLQETHLMSEEKKFDQKKMGWRSLPCRGLY